MKIKKLENEIRRHRELYYNQQPEISDLEFDKLIDELKELDPNNIIFKEIGATPRVKVKLPVVLGSLEKVNENDVIKWMKKQNDDIHVSHKLDGIDILAIWKNGKLDSLLTRGDGEHGENITRKASAIIDLPIKLKKAKRVMARGEAIMIGDLPEGFKTKRNAVSGLLNRNDNDETNKLIKKSNIHAIFYELIEADNRSLGSLTSSEIYMSKVGLNVVQSFVISIRDIIKSPNKIILNLIDILKDKNKLPYKIDGLVLAVNNSERQNVKIPKNKIAFKVNDLPIKTKVFDIEWFPTRTGRVVPVIKVEPVDIDGVIVENPTGHNAKYITTNKIGPGAEVDLVRSGDVIPYITSVIKPANKSVSLPKYCPSCESPLSTQGVDLICENILCNGRLVSNLEYFLQTCGIENLSATTLVNIGTYTLKSFLRITREKLLRKEGIGEITANTILSERNKLKELKASTLLTAIGIPKVGSKNSLKIINFLVEKRLIKKFSDIAELPNSKMVRLVEIPGIGSSIITSIISNKHMIKSCFNLLKDFGTKVTIDEKAGSLLEDLSFQFTGTLSKQRDYYEKIIIDNGGQILSVSNNLDYLVAASTNSASTKMQRAIKLGIKVIDEEKFLKILKSKGVEV